MTTQIEKRTILHQSKNILGKNSSLSIIPCISFQLRYSRTRTRTGTRTRTQTRRRTQKRTRTRTRTRTRISTKTDETKHRQMAYVRFLTNEERNPWRKLLFY